MSSIVIGKPYSGHFLSLDRIAMSDSPVLVVSEPIRHDGALTKAGLGVPLSTRYSFTSHESRYAYAGLNARPVLRQAGSNKKPPQNNGWPHYRPGDNKDNQVACTLNLLDCFGDAFMAEESDAVSVQEIFKRVSFAKPLCGELHYFEPAGQLSVRVALSMSKNWRDAEYDTSGGQTRAVALLRRYSYVLADLVAIHKSDVAQRLDGILTKIKDPGNPAFVVFNDDMFDRVTPKDADGLCGGWMEALVPEKMCWES
ncbi:hypothetical protein PILCRDRAFT_3268 [Piloderma croceum F 1598]|uniref:Uncharacterized protein n=1 Tax=Piloderma croceum (strain F 1598) TaxID=765440 RepID=A0A0C3BP33_PILCF|nr:hypothetical protein PILCRDRAFT_3268 [Piloderma croceum F 1598]